MKCPRRSQTATLKANSIREWITNRILLTINPNLKLRFVVYFQKVFLNLPRINTRRNKSEPTCNNKRGKKNRRAENKLKAPAANNTERK